ncbi:tryptophan 2,3-dioxygenase [Kitasatospora sp. NPDC058444]|uniref:tryptophan 2,3-dioxygenase n=1 Tax=Kitasatospora sp. NPDC058444 TaxID=3346504 RepID=UPI0036549611
MAGDDTAVLDYSAYLALDELMALQRPRTDVHDELLFIVVHQAHEIFFKLILHEFAELQRTLADGDSGGSLRQLHRLLAAFRAVVGNVGLIETMTADQFNAFRSVLNGSGFQSAQFRQIEAVLGRREAAMVGQYPRDSAEWADITAATARPSVFDSLLNYLSLRGYPVPQDHLQRDTSLPLEPSEAVQLLLVQVYRDGGVAAQLCERLLDLDELMQEWRYRHAKMAERIIGAKPGTGGSAGAAYLRGTLHQPVFPDLWAIRSEM